MKSLIVIPARWNSSRFPGKPLTMICGKTLIERVWEKALGSRKANFSIVATDDQRINSFCKKKNIKVVMTSKKCRTGTDRVFEVSKKIHADIYVNLQGDEPLINSENIDIIINSIKKFKSKNYIASTGYCVSKDLRNKNLANSFLLKSLNNRLIYLSRSEIPSNYKKKSAKRLTHIGIMGYTKKGLKIFANYKSTPLEINESNETLRLIENDDKIYCCLFKNQPKLAVDYPSDVKEIEKYLKNKKRKN